MSALAARKLGPSAAALASAEIAAIFSKPEERLKEGKSRMMQILKGAVIAIIVIYAISFLGLILLVNYFPWGGIGTG